jgi:hypothetical protein
MNLPDRLPALASNPLAALGRAGPRGGGWAMLLLVSACQAQPVAPAAAPVAAANVSAGVSAPADEAALLARLRTEIGEARCTADTQCRTLGIGHKACGGPQQWWAWSTLTARGERLQAWADELAALQKKRQEASGMLSNCLYVADPGTVCQAQRCVLRSSAAANAR